MEYFNLINNIREVELKNDDINSYIANFVLDNLHNIESCSLDQFAKLTNTSKPSIMRFCKNVGVSGFSEFKFLLKQYIKESDNISDQFNFKKSILYDQTVYTKYNELQKKSFELTTQLYIQNLEQINQLIPKMI